MTVSYFYDTTQLGLDVELAGKQLLIVHSGHNHLCQ